MKTLGLSNRWNPQNSQIQQETREASEDQDMEDRDSYSSLQEFSEEPPRGGNRFLQHGDDSPGPKPGLWCLTSPAARLMATGLLVSVCTNVVLIVLLVAAPQRDASSDASLRLKLNSVQRRYVQLCEDYTALGQSCSRTVGPCAECPAGWKHLADQCYYFSSDKLDWLRSKASCEQMDAHLIILHSMEQHDAVEEEAKRIGGFDFYYWIGLSDIEKEGDWRWVDNTELQHKYWDEYSSEPDNHQSGGEQGEDCATLNSQSKTWFDVPCDFAYKRICQTTAVQLH